MKNSSKKKILGVIPARGGSKGIPQKNTRLLLGKPLIAWSIESAKKSKRLDQLIVSTDDNHITAVARQYGADVLKRPEKLATDTATTLSVLQHVISEIDAKAVVVLQPTSPIRDSNLIDDCITQFLEKNSDNLATGSLCKNIEYGTHENKRRQDIEGFFYDDGNVYILTKELIRSGRWTGKKSDRIIIDQEQNHEIDSPLDFEIAEMILRRRIRRNLTIRPDIKMLAMDVDGVLTDGGMYYSIDGKEEKKFNTRDGKGIELLRNQGIKTAILTQENTSIVERRADKLKIDYCYQGVKNKLVALEKIASENKISLEQIAFIGDDLNDTEALKAVGFSATPKNGVIQNKTVVNYICESNGGDGCVRELCDLLLSVQR